MITVTLTLKCPKHPRYTGVHKTRRNCIDCGDIYELRRPVEQLFFGTNAEIEVEIHNA